MKLLIWFFCSISCLHASFHAGNERLLALINYPKYPLKQTGNTIKVAIIDSGLSHSAKSLHKNLIAWKNFVEPEMPLADYDAYEGHGTAVTDIILQFAPNVQIISLAVSNRDGGAKTNDLVNALKYAFSFSPDIINISLSVPLSTLNTVKEIVGENRFHQALIIVSAGNEQSIHQVHNFSNLIKVGALTLSAPGQLCFYSDYGVGVDIAAPAGTANDGIATIDRYGEPRLFNGTSAAAPLVTGLAVLVAEKYPHARGKDLKNLVLAQSIRDPLLPIAYGRTLSFKDWD